VVPFGLWEGAWDWAQASVNRGPRGRQNKKRETDVHHVHLRQLAKQITYQLLFSFFFSAFLGVFWQGEGEFKNTRNKSNTFQFQNKTPGKYFLGRFFLFFNFGFSVALVKRLSVKNVLRGRASNFFSLAIFWGALCFSLPSRQYQYYPTRVSFFALAVLVCAAHFVAARPGIV
jgi:hypothetical protein